MKRKQVLRQTRKLFAEIRKNKKVSQKLSKLFGAFKKSNTFALAFEKEVWKDPLAQLVEHNTFNVGVMGSSPMRITFKGVLLYPFFVDYQLFITENQ